MTRDQRKRWFSIAYSAFLVIVFCVIGATLLLAANGFQVNWRTLSFQGTGTIVLAGSPANVQINVDGNPIANQLPSTLRFVSVGTHSVTVSAPTYQPWQLSPRINASEAVIRDHVVLWLAEPRLLHPETPPALPDTPLPDPTLLVSGLELYQLDNGQKTLVTRFSEPPVSVARSVDRAHVFIQIGRSVYVTELNGENTTKLLDLSSDTPTPLVPSDDDIKLSLRDGGPEVWQIR